MHYAGSEKSLTEALLINKKKKRKIDLFLRGINRGDTTVVPQSSMLPSNLADIEPEDLKCLKCGCSVSGGFPGLNLHIVTLTLSVHIILAVGTRTICVPHMSLIW